MGAYDFPINKKEPTKRQWEQLRRDMRRIAGPKNAGQYQHNIVSAHLRVVSSEYGMLVADQLVEEFKLTNRFNIHPIVARQVGDALQNS